MPLPATISVFQGEKLGRPSQLSVRIPEHSGSGISVTGHAVCLGPTATGAARGDDLVLPALC